MNKQLDEISNLKRYFENLPKNNADIKTKENGLRLIELIIQLKQENSFLREKVIKADKDFDWIENKANEWMLKAMQNSQVDK